jgi:hypothetical protein
MAMTQSRHGDDSSAQTGPRKRGFPKFIPTAEQKRFVGLMAAGRLTYDEISSVIVNPVTGKSIDRNTLTKAFAEELRTGRTKLKSLALSKLYERVLRGDQWALAFVLRHVNGFTEDNISIAINSDGPDAESEGIQVEFVRAVRWGRPEDDKAKIAKVIEGLPQADLKPL